MSRPGGGMTNLPHALWQEFGSNLMRKMSLFRQHLWPLQLPKSVIRSRPTGGPVVRNSCWPLVSFSKIQPCTTMAKRSFSPLRARIFPEVFHPRVSLRKVVEINSILNWDSVITSKLLPPWPISTILMISSRSLTIDLWSGWSIRLSIWWGEQCHTLKALPGVMRICSVDHGRPFPPVD